MLLQSKQLSGYGYIESMSQQRLVKKDNKRGILRKIWKKGIEESGNKKEKLLAGLKIIALGRKKWDK